MIFKSKSKIGFTLIEILVVIALIGILAGVLLVSLQGVRASARDAQRKADLETIQSALEIYKSTCGKYPTSLTSGGSALKGCGASGTTIFLSSVPKDPLQKNYTYSQPTTNTYTVQATMESGQIMQVSPQETTFFTPTATPIPTNTPIPTATPTPCRASGAVCDNDGQCCSSYCISGKKCR